MIDRKPMVYYCIATLIGCYSSYQLLIGTNMWIVLPVAFFIIMMLTQNNKYVFIAFIFLVSGFLNYYSYFHKSISYKEDIRIEAIGDYNCEGRIRNRKVIVYGDLKNIKAGETIFAEGSYKFKPQFEKGIVGEFDIKKYSNVKDDFITKIYSFKEELYNKYSKLLGKTQAGEVMAAAFGDVSYIGNEEKQDMSKLGIIHVISVSGMHMALIFKICEMFLGVFGGIFISLLYCLFTGFSGSTFRSWVMIVVLKISKKVYRNYDALSSISLSALILMLIYPYYVLDIGCILSYLAVLGITLYYKKFRKAMYFLPGKLDEYIALSLSAQIFTFPVCTAIFNSVSLSMLQGNILIVPIYSAIVVIGNLSMLVSKSYFLFKITCIPLKLALLALSGGKQILLNIYSGLLYLSYIDALVFMMIYISYILIKSGKRKFIYMPLFTIILYAFSYYSYYTQLDYVKLGNSNGVIYRYGFKSVLYTFKPLSDNEDYIKKKFNVLEIKNVDEDIELNKLNEGIKIEIQKEMDKGKVYIIKNNQKSYLDFLQKTQFMKNESDYDIIYVYYEKSYNHYDRLISVEIKNGRLFIT